MDKINFIWHYRKAFNVVRNIYDNVKSCVQLKNNKSAYFNCYTGARQGESLSPLCT